METVTVKCPQCGALGTVSQSQVGQQVSCGKCGAIFAIGSVGMVPPPLPSFAPQGLACQGCGKALGGGDTFCPGCGRPVSSMPSPGIAPEAPTPGLAVASLILGILGCFGITAIIGLILGVVALNQINRSRGRLGGQGMAVAGIVVSSVLLVFCLFYGGLLIPRLMGAARQAKESTLRANLLRLRSAVAAFQADTGVYPARLEDVVATTAPATGITGTGIAAPIPGGSYKGPYLTVIGGIAGKGLPKNPFVADADTTVSHHWTYASGNVTSAITGATLDGVSYTAL
jgi:hypothetical protein